MNVRATLEPAPRPGVRRAGSSLELLDAKMTPPPLRRGVLSRGELLARATSDPAAVVVVAGPPGYGKSTFLRQLADRADRATAWVSLDATDDDPTVLLSYIATVLDRVESLDPTVFDAIVVAGNSSQATALARLTASLWRGSRPTLLVIDDLHQVRDPDCRDALSWLAEHLPAHIRLAVASRTATHLPLGRLRARGQLLEIGPRDLALSRDEVARVLADAGIELPADRIEELTDRSEGWPAAVYLASLSLRSGRHATAIRWQGSDRYLADFVRSEILDQLEPDDLRFLRLTSVLVRMNGELADAVAGSTGGAARLERLAATNQFLVPLDARGEWYRYHRLLQDVLRAELGSAGPDEPRSAQSRASAWHDEHGDVELAVEYAYDAGDLDRVATLMEGCVLRLYRAGRIGTLDRWFEWFDDTAILERHVPLAILGAILFGLLGRTTLAERWADAAATGRWTGSRLPDGSTDIDGWQGMVGAMMGRQGLEQMRIDAGRAVQLLHPAGSWRSMASLLAGMVDLLDGSTGSADGHLAQAARLGIETGGVPSAVAALGMRASLAARRGDWTSVAGLVDEGLRLVREHHLEAYSTSALIYALDARLSIRRAASDQARRELGILQRMRPILTAAVPVLSAITRMEMAAAYLALGDAAGARTVLREAAAILALRPGLGVLPAQLAELTERAAAVKVGIPGATTLTSAELRLLSYLPSHLTFREIAARLFVSPNTVKTQAIAIYGKLGVSSRGDAITTAVEVGLLDHSLLRVPGDLMHSG